MYYAWGKWAFYERGKTTVLRFREASWFLACSLMRDILQVERVRWCCQCRWDRSRQSRQNMFPWFVINSLSFALIILTLRLFLSSGVLFDFFSDRETFFITGIPDEPGNLRPLCWKLLLNYLPPTKSSWLETLKRKRELYDTFIGERKNTFFYLNV